MFHSGNLRGLFGLDNIEKTFQKVVAVFSDCSIPRISFRAAFGSLFLGKHCILNRRIAFGDLFWIPLSLRAQAITK